MTSTLIVAVKDLPGAPVDAAAQFYAAVVPSIRADLPNAAQVVIQFEPADHSHRAWRLAAVQELAREAAPTRVNAIVGGDSEATEALLRFIEAAPGITGQLLAAG